MFPYQVKDLVNAGWLASYHAEDKELKAGAKAALVDTAMKRFNKALTLDPGHRGALLGKAGMARVHQEVTGSSGTKGTTNKWLPLAAVGFNYAVVENVTLGAEYDHLFGKSNTAPSVDAGFVNLTYTIPMNG